MFYFCWSFLQNDLAGAVGGTGVAPVEENDQDKARSYPLDLNASQRPKQEV